MNKLGVAIGGTTLAIVGGSVAALALAIRPGPNPARGTIAFLGGGSASCRGKAVSGVGPLHLVAARGGLRRPFLPQRRAGDPSWSPDGRSLAFTLLTCGARPGTSIAVADSSGRKLRLLTRGPFDREPAWSPDGRTIAFVRETPRRRGGPLTRLFAVPSSGGKARQIGTSLHIDHPSWSPDGKRLVVTRGPSGVGFNRLARLYVLGRDGKGLRRVTSGDVDDWRPAWSPDGQWIAFTRMHVPSPPDSLPLGMYLVRPDGTGLRRLSKGSLFDAAWSPDGKYVAASVHDFPSPQHPHAGWSIRVMKAHGWLTGTRYRRWPVTPRDGNDFEPTWRAQ